MSESRRGRLQAEYLCADYAAGRSELEQYCESFSPIRTGHACGYRVLKFVYGAGDTFISLCDPELVLLRGFWSVTDTNLVNCAGDVPEACAVRGELEGGTDVCAAGDAAVTGQL